MQIGGITSTTQARLNFRTSRPANPSPLNPLIRPSSSSTQTVAILDQLAQPGTTHESTKTHLSNLDKLLQKQPPPPPPITKHLPTQHNKGPKRLFEGLDLAKGIWPQMKAMEDMSPRNLHHLQRLLSMSADYSPRSNLGHRWRDYHGRNDWEGLLDPLDHNLRREVVRYGEFVQSAYHAFHSNPTTSADGLAVPRHVALTDKSYKVTKSLYATSSVGLPKWVDDLAPDLGWLTQRSSWIGYVAVCDDKREIARMGRRDIVIALRGTATCLEWVENMRDFLVRLPNNHKSNDHNNNNCKAKVECGFLSLYKTSSSLIPSLAESLVKEVTRLMELYKGETLSITVTGHSLGAALALLAANDLSTSLSNSMNINGMAEEAPPIAVYSFGGPRVGNRGFVDCLTSNGVKVLRVVNSQDMVTRVPGMFVSEMLDEKLRREVKANGLLDVLDNNMPWAYSHVGKELRVDSKMSPFLKPNADVGCCHDLEAYLHLVDGFLSSNCPFRANAKRSLVRLLHEQGSNVKKLYTSKAKALTVNLDKEQALISTCLPSPS
ncbi:hypothetical protein Sjap_020081 [Stephania japonica]|uniref:Fungal lipase-type domain-containing protein n=1 Tax=Stephania japonica TaxID=461633 RepID=A0AAP0F5J5_9MAGN